MSEFRPKSLATVPTRSHLYSPAVIVNALRLSWVVVVISGELGAFFWSLSGCHWPAIDAVHNSRQKVKPTHVLLIADTQVQHPILMAEGSWWANPIRRIMCELNTRKNWHVTSRLRPHAVIFLGDMLANGKSSRSLEEYEQAVHKFKSIFEMDHSTAVYYIPGNNDVGLGSVTSISKNLRSYYTKNFGPLNQNFVISNHTFVGLDAPGLVDEDYHRHAKYVSFDDWKPIPDGPISFVKELSEHGPGNVILLSHIPLSRSEMADCGPLREKGRIRRTAGRGYQSMLGKQTTSFLLQNLEPLAVFSADNRDYCDYTHVVPGTQKDAYNPSNSIREVTVKSFSMSVHIKRPGFQLLSLVDPAKMANPGSPSFIDRPCLLPDQYRIYTSVYLPSFLVTLFILLFLNFRRRRPIPLKRFDTLVSLPPSPRSSGRNSPNPLTHADAAQLSATWSPFSPIVPMSPRPSLPSYLRTPHSPSGSSTHLVASLPGSPVSSSPSTFMVPLPYSGEDEGEDDDTMYPAQYAVRREAHTLRQREEDEWSYVGPNHGRDEEDYDIVHGPGSVMSNTVSSEFISAPSQSRSSSSSRKRAWSWSYTFVLKGRRRRLSLAVPSWTSLRNLWDFFGFGSEPSLRVRRRNRGGLMATLADALSVFWPAVVVWMIINWTVL
ncbi:hypothetical protein BDZ97DRAFT_1801621 [Flammula alnicola]|nr:hypothetical protein BDZ97DRAFT_1801621 [Flammula alnicola]